MYPGFECRKYLTRAVFLMVLTFTNFQDAFAQSNSTTTVNITLSTSTSMSTTTTTITTSMLATQMAAVEVKANNLPAMVIGVTVGVVLVLLVVCFVAVTYGCYKRKRKKVHPDSESIASMSISLESSETVSSIDSRPTTASHITFEEDRSKPVTMTPFALRKLFVETFPYSKWRRGFDGSLRPRMGLRFVHPGRYKRTLADENAFRRNIRDFEMRDSHSMTAPPSSQYSSQVPPVSHRLESLPEHGEFHEQSRNSDV